MKIKGTARLLPVGSKNKYKYQHKGMQMFIPVIFIITDNWKQCPSTFQSILKSGISLGCNYYSAIEAQQGCISKGKNDSDLIKLIE